ncbi:MAG: SRPBCC family protein [Myxococcales bacterium]|nr:SRPBCC family protein [Myxococcales bacterium]
MTERPVGHVRREGKSYTLVLEREYPVPCREVWRALTEPDLLSEWLGHVTIDPRVGGTFEIDFGGEDRAGGRILRLEPLRMLEFEWGEQSSSSVVRFELMETEDGTRLVLTHALQSESVSRSTAPGWHAHLDLFEGTLRGARLTWDEVYAAAVPRYAGAVPGPIE